MNKYYIKGILLEGCSYSNAAFEIMKEHKLSDNITWVNQSNKEKFKTEEIKTFPQIYLNKINSNGNLLLGGYQELSDTINTFYNHTISNEIIDNWIKQTKWSKKATLRLIQLLNSI